MNIITLSVFFCLSFVAGVQSEDDEAGSLVQAEPFELIFPSSDIRVRRSSISRKHHRSHRSSGRAVRNNMDPDKYLYQEQGDMWGGFENNNAKFQNWVNDPNSGNYKLANEKKLAFDNGEFNKNKKLDFTAGAGHVRNDAKYGNYVSNSGFGGNNRG